MLLIIKLVNYNQYNEHFKVENPLTFKLNLCNYFHITNKETLLEYTPFYVNDSYFKLKINKPILIFIL